MSKMDFSNNVKILGVLGDGEGHVFKMTKNVITLKYKEKNIKNSIRIFDYNNYYRLSFVDDSGDKKTTDTAYYQPITKAITNSIINFKIETNTCGSNKTLYTVKIANGKYNDYSVEVVNCPNATSRSVATTKEKNTEKKKKTEETTKKADNDKSNNLDHKNKKILSQLMMMILILILILTILILMIPYYFKFLMMVNIMNLKW